jgi:hypothetical protein
MSLSIAYVSTVQNMSYVLIPWSLYFLFRTNIARGLWQFYIYLYVSFMDLYKMNIQQ